MPLEIVLLWIGFVGLVLALAAWALRRGLDALTRPHTERRWHDTELDTYREDWL